MTIIEAGESFFAKTRYDALTHYTTEQGLYGVLDSGKFWATHYSCLNDTKELSTGKEALARELSAKFYPSLDHPDGYGPQASRLLADNYANRIVDILHEVAIGHGGLIEPYIVSFCGPPANNYAQVNGLLSQWRAYGRDGGYAIELDTKKLEGVAQKLFASSDASLSLGIEDVVYDSGAPAVGEIADQLAHLCKQIGDPAVFLKKAEGFRGLTTDHDFDLISHYYDIAALWKHIAFEEEREVRITAGPMSGRRSKLPVKFRNVGSAKIPYIELFGDFDLRPSIKRVLVGPHPLRERRAKTLQQYLKNLGLQAEVTISATPYLPQ